MVFNPQFSANLKKFKKENKKLAEKIRHSKKPKGSKVILIPGDQAAIKRSLAIKTGVIDVKKELWKNLISLTK